MITGAITMIGMTGTVIVTVIPTVGIETGAPAAALRVDTAQKEGAGAIARALLGEVARVVETMMLPRRA